MLSLAIYRKSWSTSLSRDSHAGYLMSVVKISFTSALQWFFQKIKRNTKKQKMS